MSDVKQANARALKVAVEVASGVPARAQRILCRGRVLMDDTTLSSARVEDGDTLLLVRASEDVGGGDRGDDASSDAGRRANAEGGGNGTSTLGSAASGNEFGDLSNAIAQLFGGSALASAVGGALTVEFSIGAPVGAGRASERANANAGERVGNNEDTLRRFVGNVERTIEAVRVSSPEMPRVTAERANAGEEGRGATHYGVQCDACGVGPVTGARFKSVAHEDFDLCQACFEHGIGRDCGPFARLDLPLPSGLPPIVVDPAADAAPADNASAPTPRARSEVAVGGLGELLRSAANLARASAPILENIAERFAPATRENSVETQVRSLQLASVMQSVGSLWCELARAVAVVPPPPQDVAGAGAQASGEIVGAPRSVFTYPRLAHIAPSGEMPHTRPPGMPLHNSATFVNGQPAVHRPVGMTGGVRIISGPDYEGMDDLPEPIQQALRQEIRAAEERQHGARAAAAAATARRQAQAAVAALASQRAAASQTPVVVVPTATVVVPTAAPPEAQGPAAHEHGLLNRTFSTLFGSMFRSVPAPSFITATNDADRNVRQRSSRDSVAGRRENRSATVEAVSQVPQVTTPANANADASAPTPAPNAAEQNAVASTSAPRPADETRGRSRHKADKEEANARPSKSANVDDGMSPAASAARRAKDIENAGSSSKSPAEGPSRASRSALSKSKSPEK